MSSFFIAVLIAFASTDLLAGNSSSGGGELLGDSENPWFANIESVMRYCVEVDDSNFGLPLSRIKEIVKEGFDFWKDEFSRSQPIEYYGYKLNVLPRKFSIDASCTESSDIRFQFGVISKEQAEQLQNPNHFVAAAIRTHYDEHRLKGKGFVYVSPENGPFRMAGKDLREHPWSYENGRLLHFVILHELGHIFGIPHRGNKSTLMSSGFPEMIVQKSSTIWVPTLKPSPEVFQFRSILTNGLCYPNVGSGAFPLHKALGIPTIAPCLKFKIDKSALTAFVGDEKSGIWDYAGQASFKDLPYTRTEQIIELRLSEKQNVFPNLPQGMQYFGGPEIIHWKRQGSFVSSSKIETPIFLDLSPGCFSLNVTSSGKIQFDMINSCGL